MLHNTDRFNKFVDELNKKHSFEIKFKESSLFMKLLSFILFFNKGFSTIYITTIGRTIYFPTKAFLQLEPLQSLFVVAHEYMHMKDNKRFKALYPIMYLFPQIFALLALLAFVSPWFLFFLLCLLPIPSLGRTYIEYRGYTVTLYMYYLYYKDLGYDETGLALELYKKIGPICSYFNGPFYYFMWPFKLNNKFRDTVTSFIDGTFEKDETILEIEEAFKNSK